MPRHLAAIIAADVVGYSRLLGEDESRTLSALRQMRLELFNPSVARHGGKVIKSMGDVVSHPQMSLITQIDANFNENNLEKSALN